MRVVSLGSGSDGNAILVQHDTTTVLVDDGFPLRELKSRLHQAHVRPEDISAILLTHEHSDHAGGARTFARLFGIPLIADPRTLNALCAMPERGMPGAPPPERVEMPVGHALSWGRLEIVSFPVSHDAVAPCGYVLSSAAWRVFVATDTGMVTDAMLEAMRPAHLIIVEANHDHDRLVNGPYPWYLKQRILGPTGHLSNDQTKLALASVLDDGPRWIWLAHLSRTNNTPDIARACIREHLRQCELRHVQPHPLPHAFGPMWDSAELWTTPSRSSPADAPVPLTSANSATE
ncbi:MAG TPA: MBL fold metallo-hydrolase [Ktedonobacterales bacterium]|nr:MBL fold metallo-hydrolase [Ktedonobacterales bacterium]